MTEDTSNVLEFIAPLPLDKCVRRLEARHESMKWFSWDWQRRTWISVRQQDPDTYRFAMKRIEKSSFIAYGSLAVVRGYLRRLDGEHTVVLAEKHIAYFWFVLPLITLIGLLAAMALADDPNTNAPDLGSIAVFTAAFELVWLVISWWQVGAQMRELIGALKEALTGDMFPR